MKAIQDFILYIDDNGQRTSYKEGESKKVKKLIIRKGVEIPKDYIKEIVEKNLEYVDVQYINKVPQLPKDLAPPPKPVVKDFKIKKREHSMESLTKLYDEKGFSALRDIGDKFNVKGRSKHGLITDILNAQEEKQRKGL